jgi:uncharacterized protein YcbK (DUF882 family)
VITLIDYWMGRDRTHTLELTPEIEDNALRLLSIINPFLTEFGQTRAVTSGWRPPSYNQTVPGAARFSRHMTGQAIDLEDHDAGLKVWLQDYPQKLDKYGLWMEFGGATKGWVHLQSVPPKSGRRVFYP